jgi:Acetyltransferase (GNAT) domain
MVGSAAKSTRVATRELSSADFDAWIALVAASDHGSVYALPAYLDALCRVTRASFRIVGAFLDDRLVGGIPLFERRARSGTVVANRLLLYYNGVVLHLPPKKAPSDATAQELIVLQALVDDLAHRSYAHLQLHNRSTVRDVRPFLAAGWRASLSYTYVLPLGDLSAQWERVDPNLRRLISRCEREGISYREDDDFDALFRLHLSTHRRKGAPLYLPEKTFAAWFRQVHGAGLARLGHAVLDGKVIASQLMLTGPHAVAHTVCAGADEDYLRTGASAFLRWHGSLALARAGHVANDLTDAALNPLTRFKSQLGGELMPTWSLTRGDSLMYRLESTVQRWRAAASRSRGPTGGEPE